MARDGRSACGLVSAFLFLAAHANAQRPVRVVDDSGGPGVHFTSLQAAVDGAPDGSVLLIKDGTYSGCTIAGKSLVLAADIGPAPVVTSILVVRDLGAAQAVSFHGLRFEGPEVASFLYVTDCAGTVWIEDCALTGIPFSIFAASQVVTLLNAASVVMSRCTLVGGNGANNFQSAPALLMTSSSLHVFDSTFVGPRGADGLHADGDQGGAGIEMRGSGFLYSNGCVLTGGDGGSGGAGGVVFAPDCTDGGPGGHGLWLRTTLAEAWLAETQLFAGAGGLATKAPCANGPAGLPLSVPDGGTVLLGGTKYRLDVLSPVRSGSFAVSTLSGHPGDAAWVLLSGAPGSSMEPALGGTLVTAAPFLAFFAGILPGSGTKTFQVPVQVGPTVDAFLLYEQALFLDLAAGVAGPSSPAEALLLNAAF